MTQARQIIWLFRINALINWSLSLGGIIHPISLTLSFGGPEPNYPFLVRLWCCLVFMFGLMFWDTSTNLAAKAVMMKYNWMEKMLTAIAVTTGFLQGDVPPRLMSLVVLTNWLWIPPLIYYDLRWREQALQGKPRTRPE
jgi:hypothetical protein